MGNIHIIYKTFRLIVTSTFITTVRFVYLILISDKTNYYYYYLKSSLQTSKLKLNQTTLTLKLLKIARD